MTILGIESTAHTFGIGVVRNGKILANVREMYTTESGGIIPLESAKHHAKISEEVYAKALKEAKIKEKDISAVAFSNAPGLAPCLIEGMKFAKQLAERLNENLGSLQSSSRLSDSKTALRQVSSLTKNVNAKNMAMPILKQSASRAKRGKFIPLIPVNHCIAHLEIGKVTGARDPVMLYVSGANTQIIAYEAGKYRIFGETLDLGVGNFIDTVARFMGLGFPGGPKIEQLAKKGKYIELPYSVKGMDIALSGIQTNLRQKIENLNNKNKLVGKKIINKENLDAGLVNDKCCCNSKPLIAHTNKSFSNNKKIKLMKKRKVIQGSGLSVNSSHKFEQSEVNYTLSDLAFSLQETVFAMLVETAERALAHTGKKELLLGGGVPCNSRLVEMCKIMCRERGCKLFVPSRDLLVDNGTFIAYLGEIMFKSGIRKRPSEVDIAPRERTDDVDVVWR